MKIEKLNDNQIRCTLTREDLEEHQIRLSELAYGTDKAKKLFRDMMQQAQIQFGFEADNLPLMIEAIPVSTETIMLIITKVEDPEELDTRFSKFSPFKGSSGQTDNLQLDGADNILDLFQKLHEAHSKPSEKNPSEPQNPDTPETDTAEEAAPLQLIRLYRFSSLDNVISAAKSLQGFAGINTLYKEPGERELKLVLHQSFHSPEDFNKICNILTEYGEPHSLTASGEAYLKEHSELISKDPLNLLVQI